jgi:signal transduction histidine kinase
LANLTAISTVASLRTLEFTEAVTNGKLLVAGDRTVLQQLLSILLDSAVKYTPVSGRVSLSLEERSDKAVLKVADSGIGIAP